MSINLLSLPIARRQTRRGQVALPRRESGERLQGGERQNKNREAGIASRASDMYMQSWKAATARSEDLAAKVASTTGRGTQV